MKDAEFNTPLEKVIPAERAAKAAVSVSPLVGTWTACDRRTNGIVRIVIAAKGAGITVQVFGACTPTPCDWGVVDGNAYAANVSATDAIAFTAQYKFSFKTAIVTGLLDQGSLIVETYNVFTDGSGRSNYYSRGYFCKAQ
jgi:hypothetical protein